MGAAGPSKRFATTVLHCGSDNAAEGFWSNAFVCVMIDGRFLANAVSHL
jgi:hypothetical protein